MPRANRHFLTGHIWHITHRCHKCEFLLRFAHDRWRYLHWLFQARKRFGLCVLNYMVTSNHVHLLIKDTGHDVIAKSMQLVAGRTAQEYNTRKNRKGAFWEDRYHATAIETDDHLHRCLVYIDLNMVRAGVVRHPAEWTAAGYREIQAPPKRYRIIDLAELSALCGVAQVSRFQETHRAWIDTALAGSDNHRVDCWSEALAVGSKPFVAQIRDELGAQATHREVTEVAGTYTLREPVSRYIGYSSVENSALSLKNPLAMHDFVYKR